MQLLRTDSRNGDFVQLVKMLDEYLAYTDGEDHAFYDQYNKIDMLQHCVVLYDQGEAIGCGAVKAYDEISAEIKRMFVAPKSRGKGNAPKLLAELEKWAVELGFKSVILETGIHQHEAIRLYNRTYRQTENYGQYRGVETSVCFIKHLTQDSVPG